MNNDARYYSTEGGGDYKAFIEHFKRQADGSSRSRFLNTASRAKRGGCARGRIILVNTKRDSGTSIKGDSTAKIEVVDPNEAEKRRALSEAVREQTELTKAVEDLENTHSVPGTRKKRTAKKGAATLVTKSKIRRVKDVFDD